MAYFSNLEKKIDNNNKPKLPSSKVLAIVFTIIATIGYFSLFTNLVGFLKHFLLGTLGIFAYALFTSLYVISGLILKGKKYNITTKYFIALMFALVSILAIFHMAFSGGVDFSSYGAYLADIYNMQVSVGGALLGLVVYPLQKFLNVGAYIVFCIVLIVCATIIYNGIAEAKSLSKIDFKIFGKKQNSNGVVGKYNNVQNTAQPAPLPANTQNKTPVTQTIQTNQNASVQQTQSIQNFQNTTSQPQSVGLMAEQQRELSAKEIAMQKLGLDKVSKQNVKIDVSSNQLDTFKQNYMNAGGSVFSNRDSDKLNGTFGYGAVLNNTSTKSMTEQEKLQDYKKFFGFAINNTKDVQPDAEPQPKAEIFTTTYTSNQDGYNSTSSSSNLQNQYSQNQTTESSDEKLFGSPKPSFQPTETTDTSTNNNANDNSIKFNYSSPAEKTNFMDKLANDFNPEVVPDNVGETEQQPENNLSEIFEGTVPKTEIDLPKSLKNDTFATNKFDVSKINPIDSEISKLQSSPKEQTSNKLTDDMPKQKIAPYKYTKPPLDLLTTMSTDPSLYGGNVEETGHKIEQVLENFDIPAKVNAITRGPAVTRYELVMPQGVSVNRIPNLQNDIAMGIATSKRIMIQVPIPGKSAFGIEVPNDKVATVALREILSDQAFILSKSPCSFALGKDINGQVDVCSVNKMPHVLIAGSTGSGKSVCLNSLIISILYKSSPEDVKFILIDPKQVEFSIYSGLPHLITPEIISEPKKADNALGWAVKEMERRYTIMREYRIRNIEEYNNMQDVKDRYLPKMPYIIIIMDEFADIMQSPDCKDIEGKVSKLAAKARAAGIHLVLATQRPSVDVINGTAKNNFTARIAFYLSTQTDSRTILGYSGAEDLLGKGDMLYVAPGNNGAPQRLQGCYVSDEEVRNIVEYVINHNEPDYDEKIVNEIERTKPAGEVNADGSYSSYANDGVDEEAEMQNYTKDVMKEFIRMGRASASFIQRTLRVGYNKAARIIDYLAKKRYIAQGDGSSKSRAVYMTKQQYIEMFGETDFDNHD